MPPRNRNAQHDSIEELLFELLEDSTLQLPQATPSDAGSSEEDPAARELGGFGHLDDTEPPRWQAGLSSTQRSIIADAIANADQLLVGRVGRASRQAIRAAFEATIPWLVKAHRHDRGPLPRFVETVYLGMCRQHLHRLTPYYYGRELRDELARHNARQTDHQLATFVESWRKRVAKDMRFRPSHWRVAEMAPDDVRDELILQLTEAMLTGGEAVTVFERVGCEATYRFLTTAKDRLRAARLEYNCDSPSEMFPSRHESPEDLLLARGREHTLQVCQAQLRVVRSQVSRTTARWLSALSLEARSDAAELNLARVADNMKRHRSNALRALRSIRQALEAEGFESPWEP